MNSRGVFAKAQQRRLLSTILVMSVVVGVGVIGGFTTHFFDKASGPSYPKAWDPRVASLAAFVSRTRGLTFKHPVYVDFLSDKEFDARRSSDGADLSSDETPDTEVQDSVDRSLGYFSGNVDSQPDALKHNGASGSYNLHDKRIRLRGSSLTPELKLTLVHELTHALQDQNFDIARTERALDSNPTQDSWAYRALLEGDAARVAQKYRALLSKAELTTLAHDFSAALQRANNDVDNIPDFVTVSVAAPYLLGQAAIAVVAPDGNSAVDKLLTSPATHEAELIQPWLLGKERTEHPLSAPTIPPKTKRVGKPHEFGELSLLLMLVQYQSSHDALAIADGWGGGQEVQYLMEGKTCTALTVVGQSPADRTRIEEGLRKWGTGMGTAPTVRRAGASVAVTTCDPGSSFVAPTSYAALALSLVAERIKLYQYVINKGGSPAFSQCYAVAVSRSFDLDDPALLRTGAARKTMRQMAINCRQTSA